MTVTVLQGDVLAKLKDLPDNSFDTVVTSPPYWGLRDYGVDGQLGMEPTIDEHLDAIISVFAEVHRVLKQDGVVWVNYGDCYAASPSGRRAAEIKAAGRDDPTFRDKPFSTIQGVLKPKDLCMVPNRFAIAMQEWGWWVRSEIIWAKPNAIPDAIKDRPATAHEKIFMFTKGPKYFYAPDKVRQKRTTAEDTNTYRSGSYIRGESGNSKIGKRKVSGNKKSKSEKQSNTRNLRNYEPAPVQVWEIATRPLKAPTSLRSHQNSSKGASAPLLGPLVAF